MQSLKYLSALVVAIAFSLNGRGTQAEHFEDPCQGKASNVEMRECYASVQARINAEADTLSEEIAAQHLKDAENSLSNKTEADSLRRAASTLRLSQQTWRTYRDQYCKAIEYSWTNGSGAGTGYEACMFALGKDRVHQLRSDFDVPEK